MRREVRESQINLYLSFLYIRQFTFLSPETPVLELNTTSRFHFRRKILTDPTTYGGHLIQLASAWI
jgi:hypothetical protein